MNASTITFIESFDQRLEDDYLRVIFNRYPTQIPLYRLSRLNDIRLVSIMQLNLYKFIRTQNRNRGMQI